MANPITDAIVADELPPSDNQITETAGDYASDIRDRTFDFNVARTFINSLVSDWQPEVKRTEENRLLRDVEIDVKQLREKRILDEDETIVPDRVIDTNIQRELPPYINYLKNSRRLAIFNCVSNPDIKTERLELEFTRGMTYPNWETPHYKSLDGSATHGWDAVEVVYDITKPLNAGIEHIGHDKLLFPGTIAELQSAQMILRAYDLTLIELKGFVDNFGFSAEQVGKIVSATNKGNKSQDTIRVYKRYCKHEGVVYVSWFCLQYGCSDWLKAPYKLFLGIKRKQIVEIPGQLITDPMTGIPMQEPPTQQEQWVDEDITQYPVYILPYRETEKPKLTDKKGRVFLDEYKQEAQTAIKSAFINGLTRASNVFASVEEDGTGSSLKEVTGVKITGGRVLSQKVNFHSPPYPDPMIIKALQHLDLANAQETNQPSFAAMNREDSRKTAREMTIAQEQQSLLNSVQLTLFSTHIRAVYSLCWLIVQSQALQGNIRFMLIKQETPQINPGTGMPMMDMAPTVTWINDAATISETYDVRAAGDVDVIQRSEKIQQMQQDWPVVSQTVLAMPFLSEMLRLKYPDSGEKWARALETQGGIVEQAKGLASGLATILQGALKDNPGMMQSVPPEQQQQMIQMIQQGLQLGQQQGEQQ